MEGRRLRSVKEVPLQQRRAGKAVSCYRSPNQSRTELEFRCDNSYLLLMPDPHTPWPHAPLHRLTEQGVYFVTCGTYLRQHHFRRRERLVILHRGLLTVCREFNWILEAWGCILKSLSFRRTRTA